MRINLHHISDSGLSLSFKEPVSHFKSLMDVSKSEDISFEHPLSGGLHATRTKDIIHITGQLNTIVKLACSRCLELFDQTLEIELELTFAPQPSESVPTPPPKEYELDAYQAGVIYFSGDQLDLNESISEQLIMALPFQPLCHESCKGLCCRCGSNLNQHPCKCDTSVQNSPFAVLKKLKK